MTVVGMLASGCGGGSPAAPAAPQALVFPDGQYFFSVRAPAVLDQCTNPWEGSFLSSRPLQLLLKREGEEWVARAEQPHHGDTVFRFRDAGPSPAGNLRAVTGSVTGTGVVASAGGDRIDLGVVFDPNGAAAIGLAYPGIRQANGTLTGSITFIDSSREPMICRTAGWSLSPAFSPGT